jgi:nitrate reductase beta subunit
MKQKIQEQKEQKEIQHEIYSKITYWMMFYQPKLNNFVLQDINTCKELALKHYEEVCIFLI